jgi:peptide chain release factor 1
MSDSTVTPLYERAEADFLSLQSRLADPALPHGSREYKEAVREFKKLEPAVQKIRDFRRLSAELADLRSLERGQDSELKAMASAERPALEEKLAGLRREIDDLLAPRDPQDDLSVIIEIRAGAGGDEAAIFAGDLYRMYTRYAASKGFAVDNYSSSVSDLGGFKEVVFGVNGPGAFRHFKFERGVHRVQRVPATEASGRIHTSTATVAVMPESEEAEEIQINPVDLRIDTYRASGAGGQHVNKTDSAVRLTHLPTGLVVACQDERSQIKNRAKAMTLLRAKLLQKQEEERQAQERDLRRSQVGTGDRSEKIRTYNFPQDRITDHRLNANFHNLPVIMEGNMEDLVRAHWEREKAERAGVPS